MLNKQLNIRLKRLGKAKKEFDTILSVVGDDRKKTELLSVKQSYVSLKPIMTTEQKFYPTLKP
jgi:hypothetical protein